jgi:hypothetical protein
MWVPIWSRRDAASLGVWLPQKASGAIGALDSDLAITERLGEFGVKEPFQVRHAHFCNCHVLALPALASWCLLH